MLGTKNIETLEYVMRLDNEVDAKWRKKVLEPKHHHHHQFIYQPVQLTKKSNTKQLENILAKWPTQGLKNRLRVASRI